MAFDDEILDRMDEEPHRSEDELHTGLKVLSFCIPIAGAVIYFTTNEQRFPRKRQQACTAALWGIGLNIVIRILTTIAGG